MNLGAMLHDSATRVPQKAAIVCGDRVVTYEALDRSTDALALRLLDEGLEPGDRVAIHWCNSVEVATLYFACFKAGLIAVPVNNRLQPPEIAYILQHSKARLCFSQPELAPLSKEVERECPALQRIYTALPPLKTERRAMRLPNVTPDKVA